MLVEELVNDGRSKMTLYKQLVCDIPKPAPGGKSEISWSHDSGDLAFVNRGFYPGRVRGRWAAERLTDGRLGAGDPRTAADHTPKWNPSGNWILFQSGRSGALGGQ
jgi:hypothetical protein